MAVAYQPPPWALHKKKGPVLTVYAPCGSSSAAAQRQAKGITAAAAVGERGISGKTPFAVLLKDLREEIRVLRAAGVTDIIVGGDLPKIES